MYPWQSVHIHRTHGEKNCILTLTTYVGITHDRKFNDRLNIRVMSVCSPINYFRFIGIHIFNRFSFFIRFQIFMQIFKCYIQRQREIFTTKLTCQLSPHMTALYQTINYMSYTYFPRDKLVIHRRQLGQDGNNKMSQHCTVICFKMTKINLK